MNNRVVVTGIGVICPLGLDANSMWKSLIAGQSGIDYITLFDPEPLLTKFAAEVKGFDPADYMNPKEARRMDRFAQFAVAASLQAAEKAELKPREIEAEVGVIIGTSVGGIGTVEAQIENFRQKGLKGLSPYTVPMMMPDGASGQVSIALGADGPNMCTTSACSSSSDSIGVAYEIIKRGDASVMIAGGSDAPVTMMGIGAFNAARALSTRNDSPKEASRPFDIDRDGFVMGEGSAVMVLEELSFALSRGATILAEVAGYGASSDARHMAQPDMDGKGAARAMTLCLDRAGKAPEDVDYINAHGTSTPLNDKVETKAIKTVFGNKAYKIAISSTKSMMGHLTGAAGAIEAAICVLAIKNRIIPPTINLMQPDPDCDLDYVPNTARPAAIRLALSNSFGFGGHNSVLAFQQYMEKSRRRRKDKRTQ